MRERAEKCSIYKYTGAEENAESVTQPFSRSTIDFVESPPLRAVIIGADSL